MARIRTIKPEMFTDPNLAKCSLGARWLFVGMFTEADDEGRLVDSPKRLAGVVFPHEDKVTAAKVKVWIDELEGIESVRRYETDGANLLWLPNFLKHQKISHATPSRLPAHPDDTPGDSGENPEDPPKGSGTDRESLAPDLGSGSGIGIDLGSGSGSSSSTNGSTPETTTTISEALDLLTDWRMAGHKPDDPRAYRRVVTTEVRGTYANRAGSMLADDPSLTGEALAVLLEPESRPKPKLEVVRCGECSNGWVEDDRGDAVACPKCRRAS